MLYAQTLETIQQTRSGQSLDELSRALWMTQGGQESCLTEAQAQNLAEAIQARRQALQSGHHKMIGQGSRISIAQPKAQRAGDRKLSLMRRRQLAASGPMPPAMAAHFTTAELAALKIIADEIRVGGLCSLVLDAIAARAGVSKRTVQNALKEAAALGFISIRRRRPIGQLKNLPNQVRIISETWLSWLKVAKLSTPRVETKISFRGAPHGQIRQRTWGSSQQSGAHPHQASLERTIWFRGSRVSGSQFPSGNRQQPSQADGVHRS